MDITKHTRSLAVAAMMAFAVLAAGLVLAACGSDDEPTVGGSAAAQGAPGNGVDRAFAADMIPHHESAIEMAEIAQSRGQSEFVKGLAADIIETQRSEISRLEDINSGLEEAGVEEASLGVPMHQMGMDSDVSSLRTADPFDRAFIDMMIPHHQGAIRMSRAELEKGESSSAKKLAEEIIASQAREIEAMNDHRTETFGGPSPAGGVPDEDEAPKTEDGGGEHGGGHSG